MSFLDNLHYKTENLSLYFQGGVRRPILIFAGICIFLLVPVYFLGQVTSNVWSGLDFNPTQFDNSGIVTKKDVQSNPYIIGETQVVRSVNGENTLYLTINNRTNEEIGYFPFVYTVQILQDDDTIISQETYRNYLLPGEIKYIVSTSRSSLGTQMRFIEEPETVAVNYNPNENNLLRSPNIEVRDAILTEKDDQTLNMFMLFKNNDQVFIDTVDVLYLIRDTRGGVVGIGQYQFRGFVPDTERSVSLEYPKPVDREATTLELRPAVNYLDETNIFLN